MAQNMIPHSVLMHLLTYIRTSQDVDVLRETAEWIIQQLIEADVAHQIGAQRYQQTDTRITQRNGYRERPLDTRLGEMNIKIPKLRQGTYYPHWLLVNRKMAEQALTAVVVEAYVNGMSTRKIDRLVSQMGLDGIDKSTVSRINKELDERVRSFLERPLDGEYAYLWLDATFPKVREDQKVQSTALVVAVGVRMDGRREILGVATGASETEAFWTEFLRSLAARGLRGVQLVISDAHQGLKNAIATVFSGAQWQRCQVHFMRDILTHVPKSAQDEVAAEIRTIFTQPTRRHAEEQLKRVVEKFSKDKRFAKAASILEEAAPDLLAHMNFPKTHWKRLRTTNPIERINKEIKRRINVVGIFPNRDAVIRLVGAMLLELNEEWMTEKRYFSELSMAPLVE